MLVLTRKRGEKIIIDGGIVVTVLDIDRGKVRIGVECPKDLTIYREEVSDAIRRGDPPPGKKGEP